MKPCKIFTCTFPCLRRKLEVNLYVNFTSAITYSFNTRLTNSSPGTFIVLQLNTYLYYFLRGGYSHFKWSQIRKVGRVRKSRGALLIVFFRLNKQYVSGLPFVHPPASFIPRSFSRTSHGE